jgi:ABC-2 type transport system permease protein
MSAGGAMRASLRRIRVVVMKELLQLRRDPGLLRVLLVAPVLQLVVFGYAVSTDVRHTATFVVDRDLTAASRGLVDAFTASGHFRVTGRSGRAADAVAALDDGSATVALIVPPGFAADLGDGGGRVQLLIDGTNSNTAGIARGHAVRILARHAAAVGGGAAGGGGGGGGGGPPVELRTRAWYNQDLESRNYNVPAVLAMILLITSMLVTALAVVREREIGTLEQLMVSPVRPLELVAGKAIPFALVGMVDLLLITAVAVWWFEVPFAGSLGLLLAAAAVYLLAALGVGLVISTVSRTQQEAFLTSFMVLLPAMLLSGFLFPVSSMPVVFQWVAQANPMTHFLVVVRGIFLKGVGLDVLWRHVAVLAAMGAALFTFAIARFQKRTG